MAKVGRKRADVRTPADGPPLALPSAWEVAARGAFAVLDMSPDGRITAANARFCAVTGHAAADVLGQFVWELRSGLGARRNAEVWRSVEAGEAAYGGWLWRHRQGAAVWLDGVFAPILAPDGKLEAVTAILSDATPEKRHEVDLPGQIAAIGKSQAVIEFDLDGSVLAANANFLSMFGYGETEVLGRHHGLFVDPATRTSAQYETFWAGLRRGEYAGGEYKRIAKGGREVWIQATYNPILDFGGKPLKVVE